MSGETIPFRSPDERRAILALTLVADVGSVTHRQLIERFRSASRALDEAFPPEVVRDAFATADEQIRAAERAGVAFMTMPKIALVRAIVLNHAYHHRGQLSVYLRLIDVPVPSIYGPSADENPFAART